MINKRKYFSAFKLLLVIYYICNFNLSSFAQVDIDMIKTDQNYWWAEGHGVTIDEANKDALSQIIQQISVSISTDTKDIYDVSQDKDGKEQINYKQNEVITASSFASLQNVKMMVLRPEPEAHVFRWVAKDEVRKMFDLRKQKIHDFVEAGKVAEQRIQIDDALRNYYWALILSTSLQEPVYCEFNGHKSNCTTFLPQKIKSVISQIEAKMTSCTEEDNRYYMNMHFTYNGRDVSSLQMRYFDGQSFVGPLVVKNGEGMLDMLTLPADKKLKLSYEYMFRNEAVNLDSELKSMFATSHIPTVNNSFVEVSMKKVRTNKKDNSPEILKADVMVEQSSTQAVAVAPEPMVERERIELETLPEDLYEAALRKVENAIRTVNPLQAKDCFTNEGYGMFRTLLQNTGSVSLAGSEQHYDFVKANNQVLARFCKVKIKCSDGKIFMENIVFRFNEDGKIQSLAYALTKKAEDDIFNAASSWTNLSRFVILQFMEDYQTAYALKRLDFIEQIFSDDAIIITGTVLKPLKTGVRSADGRYINLGGPDDVKYTRKTKQEYLNTLKQHFKEREYIHLTFEDNVSRVINAPRLPIGTAFGIQISQIYTSPVYSDKGYLSLVLDTSGVYPIIYVRLWQPDKSDFIELNNFISKFKF